MTVSRPTSGDLKRAARGPFRDLSPSVSRPDPIFPVFPPSPKGEIDFQLYKLQEALGIIREAIDSRYSPYDKLRWFCPISDEGTHEFNPTLMQAVLNIAGYVDTVVAPTAPFEALLWAVRNGQILGKVTGVPVSWDTEDDIQEMLMLGTTVDIGRHCVYWRHPHEDTGSPVVITVSEEGRSEEPITDCQYKALKEAILERDQEVSDWREALRAAKDSPELKAMLVAERLMADEVIPLPEWHQKHQT